MIPKILRFVVPIAAVVSLLGSAAIVWTTHAAAAVAPQADAVTRSCGSDMTTRGYGWALLIAVGAAAVARRRTPAKSAQAAPERRSAIRSILRPPYAPPPPVSIVRPQPLVAQRYAPQPVRRNAGNAMACEATMILAQWRCDESDSELEPGDESDDESDHEADDESDHEADEDPEEIG
jgi:MYXO-CTERM domain-containing protein